MIYKILLSREASILPGFVSYMAPKSSKCRVIWTKIQKVILRQSYRNPTVLIRDKYRFDELRPLTNQLWFVNKQVEFLHTTADEVQIHWPTNPTKAQKVWILDGAIKLPDSIDQETGAIITHEIHHRDEWGTQIINQKTISVHPVFGTALIRTCKQISGEATAVLYGDNRFVFDLFSRAGTARDVDIRHLYTLIGLTGPIPGILELVSDKTLDASPLIKMLFEYGSYDAKTGIIEKDPSKPEFLNVNPMLRFFCRIGDRTTSLIRSIKIYGRFLATHYHRPAAVFP
jgi:hypothetical protein